ncbi:MAG: cell division topological specificity factor MinE [Clostridium sp.]|nr:cell division topological specificity factor MinE [Clostridium sp.]
MGKKEEKTPNSKVAAKERLHLVLMQDRANVSADFLELMKQEIIDVIKKYIEVDENAIDVRLTNKENDDGTNGAPALYANIPIINIKNETRKMEKLENKEENKENNKVVNINEEEQLDKTKKVEETKNTEIDEQKSKQEDKQDEEKSLKETNKGSAEEDDKEINKKAIESDENLVKEENEMTEKKDTNKKQNRKTTSKAKSKN